MAITLTRGFELMSDRYKYDFKHCSYANGWAQVDTKQDASYFGTWTNPTRREIFTYCEGDTTLTHCDTDDEYISEVRRLIDWNKEGGYWLGIDALANRALTAQFTNLGFVKELH